MWFFYVVIVAWVFIAASPSFFSAVSARQLTSWWAITVAMFVVPVAMIACLFILYSNDLVGPRFALGLMMVGASAFLAGAFGGGRYGDRPRTGLRVIGWSMLAAPMLVSLNLSLLLPIPLLVAFFIQPLWKRNDLGQSYRTDDELRSGRLSALRSLCIQPNSSLSNASASAWSPTAPQPIDIAIRIYQTEHVNNGGGKL